jgi:hypothetical protein
MRFLLEILNSRNGITLTVMRDCGISLSDYRNAAKQGFLRFVNGKVIITTVGKMHLSKLNLTAWRNATFRRMAIEQQYGY